jgi:LysR family transcriptional regulator, nitrogen assimilation regulatory protein
MQSVSAVKDLVEQGLGVSILPYGAVRRRIEDGRLHARPIIRPNVCREICLAYPARQELSPADRAVRDTIAALIAQEIDRSSAVLAPISPHDSDRGSVAEREHAV